MACRRSAVRSRLAPPTIFSRFIRYLSDPLLRSPSPVRTSGCLEASFRRPRTARNGRARGPWLTSIPVATRGRSATGSRRRGSHSSAGERLYDMQEVGGSIPPGSTKTLPAGRAPSPPTTTDVTCAEAGTNGTVSRSAPGPWLSRDCASFACRRSAVRIRLAPPFPSSRIRPTARPDASGA